MPIGVIINALSVVIGGILGALMGHKLSPKFKADITLVFGVCSMGMGISTIGLMENMPAVIFSIVIGTGIYGSIVSGMSGDHSVLISKSILDLFTAAIFACSLGMVVCMIAIPQVIIFLILFFAATAIFPLTTPGMINDFKACGGSLMLATGFRMVKLKNFPTADMIPAMVLIMPMSWFWVTYVLPLVS